MPSNSQFSDCIAVNIRLTLFGDYQMVFLGAFFFLRTKEKLCESKQETLPTSSDVKKQFSFSKIIFGEDSVRWSVFCFVCLAAFFLQLLLLLLLSL